MSKLLNRTKDDIRAVIDIAMHGDAFKRSGWSEDLADAILSQSHVMLSEYLSHGVNWNDKSKRAFCQLLDVKPVYQKKKIDALIASHCDMSLEKLYATRELSSTAHEARNLQAILTEEFANGKELVEYIESLISKGFDTIMKQGRKFYLANTKGEGFLLKKTNMRKYAKSYLAVIAAKSALDAF